MFNDIKDGYVVLCAGGKYRTSNIATFDSSPYIYAKVSGGWYSHLINTSKVSVVEHNADQKVVPYGKTTSAHNWKNLILPKEWKLIESTTLGYLQVEHIPTKVAKWIGAKK